MTRDEMEKLMDQIFQECHTLRKAGQLEYARVDSDAFANFKRVGQRLGISPAQVLMVYAEKHIDGIHSHIKGHHSQRENVRGRINDLIVYMCLLRGIVEEEEKGNR